MINSTAPAFRDLDDLILDLKGLVLVRDIRSQASAADDELAVYDAEIARVRERLAEIVRNGTTRV